MSKADKEPVMTEADWNRREKAYEAEIAELKTENNRLKKNLIGVQGLERQIEEMKRSPELAEAKRELRYMRSQIVSIARDLLSILNANYDPDDNGDDDL